MPIFILTNLKTRVRGILRSVVLKLFHKHKYDISTSKEIIVELIERRHTKFILLKCKCGKKLAFPEANFALALRYGTDKTLELLADLDKVFQ